MWHKHNTDVVDQELIQRIITDNDQFAADELIKKYYKRVYKEIYLKVSDQELAMDLTQETFIAMLRGLITYDLKKAAFRTWLIRIADNKVIDYYRSRQHHESMVTEVMEGYESEDACNIEEDVLSRISAEQLKERFLMTNQQDRDIFILRTEQGYSFDEIGMKLGMNRGTVKNKYYAIIKKARKELGRFE